MKPIHDISLAAYLVAEGFRYRLQKEEGRSQSIFCFEKSDKLDNAIQAYYSHEARVDPLAFSDELRNLKSHTKI